jgi:hypothetical protein
MIAAGHCTGRSLCLAHRSGPHPVAVRPLFEPMNLSMLQRRHFLQMTAVGLAAPSLAV